MYECTYIHVSANDRSKNKTMDVEESPSLSNMNAYEVSQKVCSGELGLSDKPGRSKVWTIFAKVLSRDGVELDFVYCKICRKAYKHSYVQTSNLVRHSCYMEKFSNTETETSMVEFENPTAEVIENSYNNISKLFTKWIINNCIPYNLIRTERLLFIFQEIARLGSKFGGDIDIERLLPTLPTIGKNVSVIYEKCFERVKAEIASVKENGFGLTTDIWTDTFTKQSYIALTIHYLNNGVLTYRLLGLQALECENKNGNIIGKVKQILENFDCKLSKTSIIVTDEVGGIIKALSDNQNIPCISQLLNNALLQSMKEVPEVTQIISSCTKLINFLKTVDFNTTLSNLLQTSFPNRFMSVYKMLKSVEINWTDIENTLHNSKPSLENLSINIQHLNALTKTLQLFQESIESLEDDTNATLHLVIVWLHELEKACDKIDTEYIDLDFLENLKRTIRFYLGKLVKEKITNIHRLALFLYPPTNKLVRFTDEEKKSVYDECIRLMKCFKNELDMPVKQEPESQSIAPLYKRMNFFSDFVESETNCHPDEIIFQEIQYYKLTRVVNSIDFNVFRWWEQQKHNFPLLYKLSCTVLATPATSAASKRYFSGASSLLCGKYKQESNETDIGKIMFLNSNLENNELDSYFAC